MKDLAGIIAILVVIGFPIATVLVVKILSIRSLHNEKMGLINQGIIPPSAPQRKPTPNRLVSLRNAVVLIFLAIGLILGLIVTEFWIINEDMQFWIIASSIILFLGVGYLVYFILTKDMLLSESEDDNTEDKIIS